jgi:hypothetical protein
VEGAIQGDCAAIDELLADFRPLLRRMVTARTDSRPKARFDPSDLVQSVLAEAAKKMVTFQRPADEFYAWLRQLYNDWGGVEPNNGGAAGMAYGYIHIGSGTYAGISPGQWADAGNGIPSSDGDPVVGYGDPVVG